MIDEDLRFLRHPSAWPNWPLLPVVHRQHRDPITGFTVAGVVAATNPLEVIEVNMFSIPHGTNIAGLKFPRHGYQTAEDLLKDWRID